MSRDRVAEATTDRHGGRRWPWLAVQATVAVAALAVLARHIARQPLPLLPTGAAPWWAALAVILLLAPITLLRAVKWRAVVASERPDVTVAECARSYAAAVPYGVVTPGRLGEVMRLAYLPPLPGGPLRGAGLVLLDRLLDLSALLWPAAWGLWVVAGPVAGAAALVAAVAGLPVGAWLRLWSALVGHLPARLRLGALALPSGGFTPARSLALIGLGVLAHLGVGLQFALLIGVLTDAPMSFLPVVGVMSLVTLANVLPLSVAGLGVREGLAALLLAPLGVPAAAASGGAFLVFLLDNAAFALVSAFIRRAPRREG